MIVITDQNNIIRSISLIEGVNPIPRGYISYYVNMDIAVTLKEGDYYNPYSNDPEKEAFMKAQSVCPNLDEIAYRLGFRHGVEFEMKKNLL